MKTAKALLLAYIDADAEAAGALFTDGGSLERHPPGVAVAVGSCL